MSSDFKHNRKSIRLQSYDYSLAGWYYVTICTKDRECLFGDILDGKTVLNEFGKIVEKWLNEINNKYQKIKIDEFIIMPDHIHFILEITEQCRGGVTPPDSTQYHKSEIPKTKFKKYNPISTIGTIDDYLVNSGGETPPLQLNLGTIIGYFKYQTTKQINILRNTPGKPIWQRNYFEHIIRNDKELQKIRWYIRNNPLNWQNDGYENI